MSPLKAAQSNEWLRRIMRCFDAAIAMGVSSLVLLLMPHITFSNEYYLFLMVIGGLLLPAVGEFLGLSALAWPKPLQHVRRLLVKLAGYHRTA